MSDLRNPFGMIVETQTLLDLGLVVVDEAGDVIFRQDEFEVSGLRDEMPAAA